MAAEAGHHPNAAYFDQLGNLHLNGAKLFDTGENDLTTPLAQVQGITAGAASASKAVVLDANKNVTGLGGGVTFAAGTGTGTLTPEGAISAQTASAGTGADTTEDTLHTFSLPANSLSANGKGVRLRAWGTTAANANNKTLKVYFGATVVTIASAVAANAKPWHVEMTVLRRATGQQVLLCTANFNAGAVAPQVATPAEDETGAIVVRTTGTNGTATANDLTESGFLLEFLS